MQQKSTGSTVKKILVGVILAGLIVVFVVFVLPIIFFICVLMFHGSQGNKEASYMKSEFAKVSITTNLTNPSATCRDVELRQECYFTYSTTLPQSEVAQSLKQSFADAGYTTGIEANNQDSVGEFKNSANSLYARTDYSMSASSVSSERPPQDSIVTIQMYKL